jgi:hypothetical protein
MKLGPYRFHAGKYHVTKDFWLFEISAKGPWLYLDIDWTDDKFPVGWCAGLNLGPGSGPAPSGWSIHWSWNAPHGEPNRLNLRLNWIKVDFSCFTWQQAVFEDAGFTPRGIPVSLVHHKRCRPYLEDGFPLVRISKLKLREH